MSGKMLKNNFSGAKNSNNATKQMSAKGKKVQHSERYKEKGKAFGNVAEKRIVRAKVQQVERKTKRDEIFLKNRNILEQNKKTPANPLPKANLLASKTPQNAAKKPQSERLKKSNLDKRPPFVVGIVHYPLCPIPPLNIEPSKSCKKVPKPQPIMVKKISKATEKRLAAKASNTENKFPPKSVQTIKPTKKAAEKKVNLNETFEKEEQSKPDSEFNKQKELSKNKSPGLSGFPEIKSPNLLLEKSQELSTNLTSTPNNSAELQLNGEKNSEPTLFSPFVVFSRGKKNARKEQEVRLGTSFSGIEDDIPTKDTVMQKLNVSIEDVEKTSQYFLHVASKEKERLSQLCEKWELEAESAPDDAKTKIGRFVEDVKTLISTKMERFLGMVHDCRDQESLVSCRDLKNFWDTICEDIRNYDRSFVRLYDLKSKNWPVTPESTFEVPKKKVLLLDKPSKMRFCNTSKLPQFSSTPKPNSEDLKIPQIKHDSSIQYVNSEQTPGRSILKKLNESSEERVRKSTHKVNFDDTVVEKEIVSENKELPEESFYIPEESLAEKLAKIDSYFTDDDEKEIRAERKLNFDDSGVNNTPRSVFAEMMEIEDDEEEKKEQLKVEDLISEDEDEMVNELISEDEDENEVFVRSLRNRKVSFSSKSSGIKNKEVEEKSASRQKKREKANASLHCDKMSCTASGNKQRRKTIAFNEMQLEQLESRKRSVRKNVRFNEDSCAACTPQKRQLQPATPRKSGGSTRKIKFDHN